MDVHLDETGIYARVKLSIDYFELGEYLGLQAQDWEIGNLLYGLCLRASSTGDTVFGPEDVGHFMGDIDPAHRQKTLAYLKSIVQAAEDNA